MTRHQLRLLACAGGALGAMVVSLFVLGWFRIGIDGIDTMGFGRFEITLRSIRACNADGTCVSVPMSKLQGMYPTMSTVTFWSTCVLGVAVAIQAGLRLLQGHAGESLTRLGYLFAIGAFCAAGATGFFFAPETFDRGMVAVHVTRTWAPVLLLAGDVLAIAALYLAHAEELVATAPVTLPEARQIKSPTTPPAMTTAAPRPRTPSRVPDSIPLDTTEDASIPIDTPPRARTPSRAPSSVSIAGLASDPPAELRGKLRYATWSVAISTAGLDAQREDGVTRLVAWREIVGAVARRLPEAAPYDGATFVDVVSTAGATLRILPWTRIDGVELGGAGEDRARAVVELVVERCPDAKLDAGTRGFVEDRGPAVQLATPELLAQHDARLT